jgi:IS5 family transposase
MKLEVVVDANGLTLGMAMDAANVSEQELLVPALKNIPVEVPEDTPVIADKGHDSDPLREELRDLAFEPIIPHRKNRVRPSSNDGRRLRRYSRRWVVERTNAWLHYYRGIAVRWSHYVYMYAGLVNLALIHMALQRF